MGYYTDYKLSIQNNVNLVDNKDIDAISKYLDSLEVFDDIDVRGVSRSWSKWYFYREDMCRLSRKFPKILFSLSGSGEDLEDMWIEYYYDGKYQLCAGTITVTYEKFDPHKLTDEGICAEKG